jgi:protoporphyrin/coproporphyrin ferrochelatase
MLVNLGTPDEPTPAAVRRYLAEFLSDRRVVELPRLAWWPILHGIVLRLRPRKSAAAYESIWTEEGSPLAAITMRQAAALGARLGGGIVVTHAMRYGSPSIDSAFNALASAGCTRILAAPLYPQYCSATTATAIDAVGATLAAMREQPSVRPLPPYYDDKAYIAALAASIRSGLETISFTPDVLLASFHGMPERTLKLGDPYHCHCRKTARLVSEAIGLPIEVAYQSRFGRARWLEPATDQFLEAAGRAAKSVAVFAPGFAADCLETLEELAIRGREQHQAAGGGAFAYLPCLNDSPQGIDLLEALVRRELAGWL